MEESSPLVMSSSTDRKAIQCICIKDMRLQLSFFGEARTREWMSKPALEEKHLGEEHEKNRMQ